MILYVYAFLPDEVILPISSFVISMTKSTFFYSSVATFLVLVVLASYFTYLIKNIPSKNDSFFSSEKKEQFVTWSSSLRLIISVLIIFSVIFIGMSQNDEHFNISNFGFMVYVGPVLLVGWIFTLFFLILIKS